MGSEPTLYFGRFRLDPQTGRVWCNKQLVPLSPKACAVLRYLSLHAGQVVPQADVRQAVWPETGGSAAALKVCIREIRKALQDDTATPRFIETIPRRGYRFIAQVVSRQQSAANSQQQSSVLGPASRVPQANVDPTPNTSHPSPSTLHPPPSLVGRAIELHCLQAALERALQGERQIVFVTGEPGIGKTALVETFLAQLVAVPPSLQPLTPNTRHPTPFLRIARGQCIEHYGAGEAYLPVLEALSRLGRETEGAEVKAALARYAPTWLAQLPALTSVTEREDVQRALVGATRERMLREIAEALEALSTQQPLTLVLEDLHWGDQSTGELLAYVARRQGPAQLLIIGTYRPAEIIASDHPLKRVVQELQGRGHCEQVGLGLLGEEHVSEYVMTRLGDKRGQARLLQDLAHLLYQRTEGNPLFMVTVMDHLLREGNIRQEGEPWQIRQDVMALAVDAPESLRQLIERQFAGLQREEQRLLEVASVIGTEFAVAAVAAGLEQAVEVVEERCAKLAARGSFVRAAGVEEWPDGTLAGRYSFLHAVYQNVLYERIAEARRMRLHRRIGERKAAAYGKRAGEVAAELSAHFEAGRDFQQAVEYCMQAGKNAARRSAHTEAIGHLTKGLALLQLLPDTPQLVQHEIALQIALGSQLIAAKGFGAAEVELAYTRAQELCQQVRETPRLFSVLAGLCLLYVDRAEVPAARAFAEQLLRLAERLNHPTYFMWAHFYLGITSLYQSELTLARSHLEQALVLYNPQRDEPQTSGGLTDLRVITLSFYLPLVLWLLGYPEQARQSIDTGLFFGKELSHPFSLGFAYSSAAWNHLECQEGQAAQKEADATIALANEHGFAYMLALGMLLRGATRVVQGQAEEGIAQIHQGLAAIEPTRTEVLRSILLALPVRAYGQMGRAKEALEVLTEALAFVERAGERFYEAELYRLKGELSLQSGQVENKSKRSRGKSNVTNLKSKVTSTQHLAPSTQLEAEECFVKALEIAKQQQAKSLELRAAMSLARLWRQQGKRTAARQVLEEVYGWFTEGFATKDLQEAATLLTALGSEIAARQRKEIETARSFPVSLSDLSRSAPDSTGLPPGSFTHTQHAIRHTQQVIPDIQQSTPGTSAEPQSAVDSQRPGEPHPTPNPQPLPPSTQIPEYLFRYEGEYWTLAFAGTLCRVRDTRGMHYLAQLLRCPNQEFHPLALVIGDADPGAADTAPVSDAPPPPTAESELPGTHRAARELLSPQARAAHKQGLAELQAELEEARAFNDSGRREKLQNDIELLTQQLAHAAGLGARTRKLVSPAEQARVNVTRTIKTAIKRITESHPALGQHLATTVKTGNFCVYTPDSRVPIRWQVA